MGSLISTKTNKDNQKDYTFWYLNQNKAYILNSKLTFKQIRQKFKEITDQKIHIYFNWHLLTQQQDSKTLKEIIDSQLNQSLQKQQKPEIFIVINQDNFQNLLAQSQDKHNKLLSKLNDIQKISSQSSNYTSNDKGHLLFQGRQTALLASSINHAIQNLNLTNEQKQFLQKSIQQNPQSIKNVNLTDKILSLLNILQKNHKQGDTNLDIKQVTQKIENSKQFTDFDPKFIYYIEQIYLKFMIKSLGKIHYINYQKIQDFQIKPIKSNSKIGIIGDFGTGLKDSLLLLQNMIFKHNVDIIIHLGDVYYAGTPQQYEVSITKPLNLFRSKVKKQIRFYSIPGNHDYYSWGLPFLCFVKNINSDKFQKQQASYFCLRDQNNKWQILGMDTAFHDSNPVSQINPFTVGPYVRKQELKWHKHRLNNFKGSTLLLSHHQIFSIHERINGQLTQYRNFSCLNPMLYAQFFEHIPYISGWFWGHQHSFMLFKQNIFGLQKGRLIGNSSYHVIYQKQNPYSRKQGFPKIPLITSDQQYNKKYIPRNPNNQSQQYFALCYGIINMQKMQKDNSIPIQYWCTPCFTEKQFTQLKDKSNQEKKRIIFDEYKIYEETIHSIQRIKLNMKPLKNKNKIYLRCQIGLLLSVNNSNSLSKVDEKEQKNKNILLPVFDIKGQKFQIEFKNQHIIKEKNQINFTLKLQDEINKINYFLCINESNQIVFMNDQIIDQKGKQNILWIYQICDKKKQQNNSVSFKYGQIFKIKHKKQQKYLSWKIKDKNVILELQNNKNNLLQKQKKQELISLWTFCQESLIQN